MFKDPLKLGMPLLRATFFFDFYHCETRCEMPEIAKMVYKLLYSNKMLCQAIPGVTHTAYGLCWKKASVFLMGQDPA